jgi:hypothetical protein
MAVLQMEQIRTARTVKSVKSVMKTMPNRLPDMYSRTLERMKIHSEEQYQLGIRILGWISFAKRLLLVDELRHAIAVEYEVESAPPRGLDEDNLLPPESLANFCAGLVAVDPKSGTVRPVHSTVEKYVRDHATEIFSGVEAEIPRACLAYLSFDSFSDGCCSFDKGLEHRLEQFPFFQYAAEYWGAHVREKYEFSLKDLVLDFLGQASKLGSAVQAMHLPGHRAPKYSQNFPKGVTALHVASSFGLKLIVRMQLEKGADIHMQDYNGWTALHRATENGHEDMVQLLLDNGADPNKRAKYGGTALHRAATGGHVAITKLLMKANADINAEDNYGGTALHRAAKMGHEEVVILLIDAGANVNKPYNLSRGQSRAGHRGIL